MNLFRFLIFLFPYFLFGQELGKPELQIEYNLKFQPDSLDTNSTKEENFVLFVNGKKSFFASLNSLRQDTLLTNVNSGKVSTAAALNMMFVPKTSFNFRIIKDYSPKITVYDRILKSDFKYDEKPDLKWTIMSENMIYGGYKCQKATTSFAGRKYTAYFTPEIPFSDGPYKFQGLPGLIVHIADSKNQYIFSLVSLKKVDKSDFITLDNERANAPVTEKNIFYNALQNSIDNRIEYLRSISSSMDAAKEREIRERLKKRNNPIELKP